MPPTHKNKKWTRTKSSHIYTQVSWKIVNSYSPWFQKYCVYLYLEIAIVYLSGNWKTNLTHFEQCKGQRGAGSHLSQNGQKALRNLSDQVPSEAQILCVWSTHFLSFPNKSIWCALGGEGGKWRGIQGRSQLSWTVYDLRHVPNGGFSISEPYMLQNIHIKSITYSL